MALIMKYIDSMQRYMDSHGDSRTKDWAMMSSPFPTMAVCLTYVYIVKVLGPRLMENRKPFQLQNTLIVYNAVQVIFSAWLFYESLMGGWWGEYSFTCQPVDYSDSPTARRIAFSGWLTGHYNFRCQPVDYSNSPRTLRMVHACWWYYFSKFTEFMDTIFFVLRKKTSQVTTLHVIHHGCMPMSVWFGVKFTPGGHSTFFGLLNTFVHIVMYTYYLFAAMGPQYKKYLWWKKYLTTFQMVQFILIMVHAFQLLFIDCNYPKAFVWWIGMHAVMFFFLFNEFYKAAYKGRPAEDFSRLNQIRQLVPVPVPSYFKYFVIGVADFIHFILLSTYALDVLYLLRKLLVTRVVPLCSNRTCLLDCNVQYKNLLMFLLQRREKGSVVDQAITANGNGHCKSDDDDNDSENTNSKLMTNGHLANGKVNGIIKKMNGLNGSMNGNANTNANGTYYSPKNGLLTTTSTPVAATTTSKFHSKFLRDNIQEELLTQRKIQK